MRGKDGVLEQLAQVPLFQDVGRKELVALGQRVDVLQLPPGKAIVEEGSRGHELFVLCDGEAEVRRNGDAAATLRAGDYFGELAVLDEGPRSATVVATTPVTLGVLRGRELRSFLLDHPKVCERLVRSVAGRLRLADHGRTSWLV